MLRLAKPLRSILICSAAAGTAAVSGQGLAEEQPIHIVPAKADKPLIYPKPDGSIQLVKRYNVLERGIGVARERTTSIYTNTQSQVQSVVDKWIDVEQAIEKQILEIIPGDEPLTPGMLYVGVATLTGSVIGRNRNLPIRLILPPTFLTLSLAYFLPKTAHNLSAWTMDAEHKYTPSLAAKHSKFDKALAVSWNGTSKTYADVKVNMSGYLRWTLQKLEHNTGLKIGRNTDPNVIAGAGKAQVNDPLGGLKVEIRHLEGQEDLKK